MQILAILLAILNGMDGVLTYIGFLKQVILEANPFMLYILDKSPLTFLLLKMLLSLAILILFLAFRILRTRPIWKLVLLVACCGYSYVFVLHMHWMFAQLFV